MTSAQPMFAPRSGQKSDVRRCAGPGCSESVNGAAALAGTG
jgi:hypothetical protein